MRSYSEKSAVARIGGTMDNKVKWINGLTGSERWVAEERGEEYQAAGHKVDGKVAGKPVKAEKKKTKK